MGIFKPCLTLGFYLITRTLVCNVSLVTSHPHVEPEQPTNPRVLDHARASSMQPNQPYDNKARGEQNKAFVVGETGPTFQHVKPDNRVYPEVKTSAGIVRGVYKTVPKTGEVVAVYRGIPYAEPPLGHLRFMVSNSASFFHLLFFYT